MKPSRTRDAIALVLGMVVLAPSPARSQAFPGDDPTAWSAQVATEYTVSLHRTRSQLVDVTIELVRSPGEPVELRMPTWRPGKYAILDPAGTIVEVRAEGAQGEPVEIRKVDKATWRVEPDGGGPVRVHYTLYANSLGDRTRHADDTHAFLSGATVFLYSDSTRGSPLRVRVDAPEGWDVATGLAPDPEVPDAWLAPNYDALVDSPLEIGEHYRTSFQIGGVPHEIVVWGPVEPDGEQLSEDFARIVEAHRAVFEGAGGALPYPRYVYLIHAQPGIGGGTEHLNSTIMQTRPAAFDSDRAYDGFLGLVSHEMFHTWNVKRLRPAGLVPYDYQNENYTDLLWIAEGTTSYYDDVTLVRAGLREPDQYLADMSSTISRELRRPGYEVQSLADSSYDAWIKFNKSTPNDLNTTVSFYTKGALVSLMLDMELRRRTENAVWLDHVLRDLYERHPLEAGGYTTADVLEALRRLSGTAFDGFFGAYVTGTEPLALPEAFAVAGVEMRPDERPEGGYLGLSLSDGTVRTVRADGPAFEAGIHVDDVVSAVDGKPLRGSLESMLRKVEPGTVLTLSIERRGEPREIEVAAEAAPVERWRLERVDEPTALQRAVYESWLGQAWPERRLPAEDPPVPSDP